MTAWITETLAATAVLMATVLALRVPVARLFGARTAYALWLLPLLRTLLPPIPGWRTLFAPAVVVALPSARTAGELQIGLVDPARPGPHLLLPVLAPAPDPLTPIVAPPLDPANFALLIWGTGAVLLIGIQLWRYRRFMRRALTGATPIGTAAGTTILLTDGVQGPVATGIVRRRILLPRDFSHRYARTAQRLVLDHEAAHHDRGDLVANLVALLLLALHWWNPIAWFAHRAFRADQELACDATVLARVNRAERVHYAEAVARSAGFATPATVSPLSPVAELKRRLRMMGRTEHSRARVVTGAVLAASLIGAGLMVSASGSAHQARQPDQTLPPAPSAPQVPQAPAAPATPPSPTVAQAPSALERPETPERPEMPERPEAPAPHVYRAAVQAQIDAAQGAAAARAAGLQAEAAAQRAVSTMDVDALVRTSLAAAREGLTAQCAAQGHPVSPHEQDFGKLTLCNGALVRQQTIAALHQARDALAREAATGEVQHGLEQAVVDLDREIAALKEGR